MIILVFMKALELKTLINFTIGIPTYKSRRNLFVKEYFEINTTKTPIKIT